MSDIMKRLREPAALAALAYAGLNLLAAVIGFLLPPSSNGISQPFGDRAFAAVGSFLNLPLAAAVAIALYLANEIAPALARARVITIVALVETGVALVFGAVCALALFGASDATGDLTFTQFLAAIGGGLVTAVAGWFAWLSWQRHAPAKPAQSAGPQWGVGPNAGVGQQGGFAPPYPPPAQPGSGGPAQFGQQQPQGAPPGGFGWTPQQPYNPQQPPQAPQLQPKLPRADDRTQLIQPISPAAPGQPGTTPYPAAQPMQPGVPPAPQANTPGYPPYQQPSSQSQPWSPGGAGSSGGPSGLATGPAQPFQGPTQGQGYPPGQGPAQSAPDDPRQQPREPERENPFGIGDWHSE